MQVDRGAFLMFLTSIGLGAGGGYVASEKDLVPHLQGHAPPAPAILPAPVTAVDAGAPAPAVQTVDAGPPCDDSTGEPEACPPIGSPTAEGGCGALAHQRCGDFKQTMKPRVAKTAIACLNKLNGAERCDPRRIDLCAHFALMNACEDRAPTSTGATTCDALVSACEKSPVPLSRSECRQAMSGLREIGREAMLDCAKKHCFDKGVLGCEAAPVGR